MANYQTEPENDLSIMVNMSLVDVLTKKIRTNIYTGKYEAGKKLIVRELSEEFGVSHTPIKDALNRLVAEGYVEAPPRKSMVVRSYSEAKMIDMFRARMMCEAFFADDIIEAVGKQPEILSELQKIMKTMHVLAEYGEKMPYERWVDAETRFHNCYMQHCGNEKIYKFYRSLDTNRVSYFTYLNTKHVPLKLSAIQHNLVEHDRIVSAIENLDAAEFIRATYGHIIRVAEDYVVDDECREKFERLKQFEKKYLP